MQFEAQVRGRLWERAAQTGSVFGRVAGDHQNSRSGAGETGRMNNEEEGRGHKRRKNARTGTRIQTIMNSEWNISQQTQKQSFRINIHDGKCTEHKLRCRQKVFRSEKRKNKNAEGSLAKSSLRKPGDAAPELSKENLLKYSRAFSPCNKFLNAGPVA